MPAADLSQERFVAVGEVRSPLTSRDEAPRQPGEGAPEARIVVAPDYREALSGIGVGDPVVVVTWLHLSDRTTLTTHPRNDPTTPLTGVFATRSPDRPNPIGLHHVRVSAVHDDGVSVEALEAVAGTPVLDIKCELAPRPTE